MIHSGPTTFNDIDDRMEHVAKAVDESGIRACLSYCMIDGGYNDKIES